MSDNFKKSNNFIPVIPMRDIIIYPQMIAPVFIMREKSIIAVENALLTENHNIILLAQKNAQEDEIIEENLYKVGVMGRILQILKFPDGSVKTLIEGLYRIKIKEFKIQDSIITADYEIAQEEKHDTPELRALQQVALKNFEQYIKKSIKISSENLVSISEIEDTGKLADILATYLNIKLIEKQKILEAFDCYERLKLVSEITSREVELLNIEEEIQEKITYKLGKTQKDYLLREKLNAIREELGGGEGLDEAEELRMKIEEANIPQNVKDHLDKEVNKLERMTVYTSESSLIRNYIETVIDLPWLFKTEENIDIERAREILDEDHYGLQDVKERILEFLAVKKLSNQSSSNIICFEGPPGVGKTSLARSITRCLGRNFAQISLGGINDESEIRGHRRTYIGSMPGRIIKAIQIAGSKNPVILLDEIEKMIASHMGDPSAAMLEVLDPAQNSHFTDHYIDIEFDLSDVFFIATANTTQNLYKPLKDRMETIYLSGYTEEEKIHIAEQFLIPKELIKNGIKQEQLKFKTPAINKIITGYTREAGVRELERCISKICRKMAVKILKSSEFKETITNEKLEKYLGVEKFPKEAAEKMPQVGLVHGLAWTEAGGELLEIEASTMPGKGHLELTGRLGEIMRESAQTAFSYARSNHNRFKLPADLQDKYDLHIHAADGATPKDGPSAGIALAIALISAFTQRPVRSDIAMTGEITLRGKILPIGGLKEKCMAALRNDIKVIIVPKSNEKDIKELPDYIKTKIDFKKVTNIDEVIDMALFKEPLLNIYNNGKKDKEKYKLIFKKNQTAG